MTVCFSRRAPLIAIIAATFVSGIFTPYTEGSAEPSSTVPGRIAFVRNADIWLWNANGISKLVGGRHASDPCWSPDGRRLLFVANADDYSNLVIYDVNTGHDTALTNDRPAGAKGSGDYVDHSSWVRDPAWSASGLIAFASDRQRSDRGMGLWLLASLGSSPTMAPQAQAEGNVEHVSLSADGRYAYYTSRVALAGEVPHTAVVARELTTGDTTTLVDEPMGAYDAAVSPTTSTVVVSIRSASGVSDLWLINLQTGDRTQMTHDAQAVEATWSPDGQWLAYLQPSDKGFELWAMPVDGPGSAPVKLREFEDIDATSGMSWTFGV